MPSSNKILIILVTLIGLNLLALDGWEVYKNYHKRPVVQQTIENKTTQSVDQCGPDCQKYVQDQISLIQYPTPLPTAKSPKPVAANKTTAVSYVPVPGTGQTMNNDWTDLPGTDFYFSPGDYSGLQSVYFEVNFHLMNGNGLAYVRLFDVTHGIGVQGSEVSTASQTSVPVESGQVSFWQGKNLIRVQAKALTADTAVFDSGRLKITTQN